MTLMLQHVLNALINSGVLRAMARSIIWYNRSFLSCYGLVGADREQTFTQK